MQTNRRTAALLATGVLSLAAVAHAEENATPATPLPTALTSTAISGYVDTSAHWNFGTGNANNPPYSFGGATKADGFNLNVVQLSISKPQDESPWAAGYTVDLWFGPDANILNSQSSGIHGDLAVRQAYVALRTPVGNGIDWKVGVFDTCIGYEGLSSPGNPHYTRSYGFAIEPTTHTGVQAAYKFADWLSATACVADTVGPVINQRAFLAGNKAESYKTYMGSIALTAPDSWGWLKGSSLSLGVVNGFNSGASEGSPGNTTSWYAGATVATPVTGLKFGAAYDAYVVHDYTQVNGTGEGPGNAWSAAAYASYQATEKLAFNLRGEYLDDGADLLGDWSDVGSGRDFRVWAFTATAQYDLWKNVLSRVEFRWDHVADGPAFGGLTAGTPTRDNAFLLAANIIYKF